MSPSVIRRTILAELLAYGSGITPGGLLELVKTKLPQTTLADIAEELCWLRDHQLVAFTTNRLDPDDRALRQYTITNEGELHLKK
jgi:hypothetical protein